MQQKSVKKLKLYNPAASMLNECVIAFLIDAYILKYMSLSKNPAIPPV